MKATRTLFLQAWVVAIASIVPLVFGLAPVAAQTYAAAGDFSAISNPNGAWSYGWSASRGSPFNLATSPVAFAGLDWWDSNISSIGAPGVWHNGTGNPITVFTLTVPPGKLAFHPGPSGQNGVVRWTAPASGTYQITGALTGIDFQFPTTTDVAILHESTQLFSGDISSYNIPLPFSIVRAVSAGESI